MFEKNNGVTSDLFYDVDLYGFDTDVWKGVSGTVGILGNKLRVRASASGSGIMQSSFQARGGQTTLKLRIPEQPTGGDERIWGLYSGSRGLAECAFFIVEGSNFFVRTMDKDGEDEETAIAWEAGWTNADVTWTIVQDMSGVRFIVNGRTLAHHTSYFPRRTLNSVYVTNNQNNDDVLVSYVEIKAADQIFFAKSEFYEVTTSTSTTTTTSTTTSSSTTVT